MWSAIVLATLHAPSLTFWLTRVDITPPELLPLGGYTARHGEVMSGIGDHLFARGLILRQGNRKVAIVACEMLTTPESLYREVKSRLPSDVELFLAATHTHSAPDSQMLNDRMTFQIPGIASYRPRWLTWYSDMIAKAAQTQGVGEVTPIVGCVESHVDANRARRKFGDPDQTFTWLSSKSGKHLLAEYAAHGTLYSETENVTRGDWPGILADRLEAPVLVGAIGDVSPKADGADATARCENLVEELLSTLPGGLTDIFEPSDHIDFLERSIELRKPTPHPTFAREYKIPSSLAIGLVQKFAPTQASVSAIRIGRLAIVGIPGEPTSHLGRQIRDYGRSLGFHSVLVISHVNGWMGYILDPSDYDRGGYEATLSFYGREEGAKVVQAACDALRDLTRNKVK